MSILGIDYGDKKIGLAKSVGNLAVPLKILENKGSDFVFKNIENICAEEQIEQIVVGMPRSHSGRENAQEKKVEDFIKNLKELLHIEVIPEDERMSTLQAQKLGVGLKGRGDDDAIAAMLILQSYLDKNS